MKKLVTALFLLASSITASASYAQAPVPTGKPFLVKMPVERIQLPTEYRGGGGNKPLARTALSYMDEFGDLVPWQLPRQISFSSGETDTIVMFMQRFTNPYEGMVVYLDSAYALLQATSVVESSNNQITFSVFYGTQPNESGYIFPATRVFSPTARQRIDANTLPLEEAVQVGVGFGPSSTSLRKIDFNKTYTDNNGETQPVHETDFFIGVQIPFFSDLPFDIEGENNQQNNIAVIGDALPWEGTFDAELHRGMASGLNYSLAWAGIGQDPDFFYSNFGITAIVSDQPTKSVEPGIATSFEIKQNFPNPFTGTTEIQYSVKEASPVTIKVFNAMGIEVATLVNEMQTPDTYTVAFDASNLPSGNYMYTMTAGGETITRAMTYTK